MSNYTIRLSESGDLEQLHKIWYASVKATHDFLTPQQLEEISIQVKRDYLPNVSLLVIVNQNNEPLGFMGMTDSKIDSLFIDPRHFGKKLGQTLISHAKQMHQHLQVDVNEDNPGARIFYKKVGFTQKGRSPLDDNGRPLPILHLEWKA